MTEPTHESEPGPRKEIPPPGMPRWVKVSLLVVAALVLIFIILKLTVAGGEHGPGRHQAGASLITAEAGGAQLGRAPNSAL